MSIATVVTRGYGTFGDIAHVVTRGFEIGVAITLITFTNRIVYSETESRFVVESKSERSVLNQAEIRSVKAKLENVKI
jgi:hypothetical protein